MPFLSATRLFCGAPLRRPNSVRLIVSGCSLRVGCLLMRSWRFLVRLVKGRKKARALAGKRCIWIAPNPLENVCEFKISRSEMAYLTIEEIRTLLSECEKSRSKDLTTIVKICLATGARWSEAEGLKGNQIRAGQIIFVKTKGKKNRAVPITEKLQADIPSIRNAQMLFKPCYSAFRKALQRAGIETPTGQLTHVLRHTFASHFMMNGGNILVLQRILGHTDIKVTMRYAHFAPDHLSEAMLLNPLNYLQLHTQA